MITILETTHFETGPHGEPVGGPRPAEQKPEVARLRAIAAKGERAERKLQASEDALLRAWREPLADRACSGNAARPSARALT